MDETPQPVDEKNTIVAQPQPTANVNTQEVSNSSLIPQNEEKSQEPEKNTENVQPLVEKSEPTTEDKKETHIIINTDIPKKTEIKAADPVKVTIIKQEAPKHAEILSTKPESESKMTLASLLTNPSSLAKPNNQLKIQVHQKIAPPPPKKITPKIVVAPSFPPQARIDPPTVAPARSFERVIAKPLNIPPGYSGMRPIDPAATMIQAMSIPQQHPEDVQTRKFSLGTIPNLQPKPRAPAAAVVYRVPVKPPPPPPPPAAPLPVLPSAAEVLEEIKRLKAAITEERRNLAELMYERRYGEITVPPTDSSAPESAVQDFHGLLVPHNDVRRVIDANRAIIGRSYARNSMPLDRTQTFGHISQLPRFADEHSLLEPMVVSVAQVSIAREKKQRLLAREYAQRHVLWSDAVLELDEYQREARDKVDVWPPEFEKALIKKEDRTLLQYCGRDQLMYVDDIEREAYMYFDENALVEDPVAEHRAFKERLVWTDAEKRIFLEKYGQHPREFKKIAAALPSKTVKDVIEYYHIYRIQLNLKELEIASRKRGRKRQITEGNVRNNL